MQIAFSRREWLTRTGCGFGALALAGLAVTIGKGVAHNLLGDWLGDRIDQQQTTFRKVTAAQAKAWQETADELHAEAAKAGDKWRADIENALTRIKADGSEAQARLQNLQQAGSTSWAALSAALAESRLAFDRATQQAWEAVKRAAPPAP